MWCPLLISSPFHPRFLHHLKKTLIKSQLTKYIKYIKKRIYRLIFAIKDFWRLPQQYCHLGIERRISYMQRICSAAELRPQLSFRRPCRHVCSWSYTRYHIALTITRTNIAPGSNIQKVVVVWWVSVMLAQAVRYVPRKQKQSWVFFPIYSNNQISLQNDLGASHQHAREKFASIQWPSLVQFYCFKLKRGYCLLWAHE